MGRADRQGDLFDDVVRFCEGSLPANSVYGFLARERDRLFPDELFEDLFQASGRRSVPPSVVATVMVLQRLDGLSDREAVDRYAFDVRWRYAAGVGGYGGGWGSFAHTVLVDMRARLRRSTPPGPDLRGGSGGGARGRAGRAAPGVRSPGLDLLNEHAGLILVPRDLQAGIGAVTIAVTNTDPVDPASFEIDELDVHVGLPAGHDAARDHRRRARTYRFYDFLSGTDLLAVPVRLHLVWLAARRPANPAAGPAPTGGAPAPPDPPRR